MALKINKLAAATTVAAALSLLATPAAAVDLPRPAAVKAFDGDALNADRHRRRWYRGRDNIDAGDIIAGVLILGGIAAIADAAKRNREERYPTEYPYPDADRDDGVRYRSPVDDGRFESRGLDRAVDMCVAEVERDHSPVANVDSVSRSGEGWRVSGELRQGAPFECSIGNDGRVSSVFVGDDGVSYAPASEGSEGWRQAPAAPESDEIDGDLDEIALAPR
jgi:hypothetical protein